MKLTLGFSPCPNDTFIFDAIANGLIDLRGLDFDVILEDVQTLNEMAIGGRIDIAKISIGAYPLLSENYALLNNGGALGKGVGPLLIAPFPLPDAAIRQCTIAIPGKNTTAHVLFSLAYPEASNKVFLRYDEIEDFVLANSGSMEDIRSVRLGVIIHENRFTYASRGLSQQTDLGSFWEEETQTPVPLGGIAARRTLSSKIVKQVEELIRQSLDHSYSRGSLSAFVRNNARELSPEIMQQHINLYVNEFTRDLGDAGKQAIIKFITVHSSINKIEVNTDDIFFS